jgi:hypothetical protein
LLVSRQGFTRMTQHIYGHGDAGHAFMRELFAKAAATG